MTARMYLGRDLECDKSDIAEYLSTREVPSLLPTLDPRLHDSR